jgi:hypothetical protein
MALQCGHWKKNWQASVGMVQAVAVPQLGQVSTDSRITLFMAIAPVH